MTVGILGLGLIGGTLARAYKLAGHKVLCCDTDQDMLSFAMVAGVVDEKMTDDNISECDLILLAIYPDGCIQWMQQHASHIRNHTIVMDCCGTKREVCNHCFPIAQEYGFTFIGAHPMAGNQFSGFKYSRADLFIGAPMVLVPHRFDDMELLEQAKTMLAPCGFGRFSVTTAADHDRMIAFTSQMPHIISNAFILTPTAQEHKGFSAGSYMDLTRVAWLNAGMWAELMMENKENTLYELDILIAKLYQYRAAIAQDDTAALVTLLEAGKKRKEEVDG